MLSFAEVDVAQPDGFRPLSIDLRTPDVGGAPVIVFLHGGGWCRGSRKVFTPGMSDAESFELIVAAGYAVASCEYRLSGEARFPAQLDDVDAAIDWLHTHGAEYGVDPTRVVLWGVSAGATLASLVGLRRSDVRGVVDWFGPADIAAMADHETREVPDHTREAQWIGGRAAERPEAARAASPLSQVHRKAPPFHISHGTADALVPFAQSEVFAEALRAADVDVELVPVEGGGHFWRNVSDTRPLFDAALQFVHRVMR
ncbi:alpha/beta hydrolase [Microbacterium sp. WCS2018Hpa-23]|uniref:alpha/beta hydrolase n=1 Tax=Microbacterium sp. WCS2018Hpa-23 TaxID=3073634 RepID=UPI002882E379|nr:alpha/beta hydrolase [Microbacterium sp. WCS2018Hpa-23]